MIPDGLALILLGITLWLGYWLGRRSERYDQQLRVKDLERKYQNGPHFRF